MLKRYLKNEKGLTLIELLVVIVILGIIAAIAIPAVGGLIDNAKKDSKVAEGIQIISAAKLYVASEDVPSTGKALTKTQLASYLDSVDDDTYEVTVTKSGSNYSYKLKGHNSVAIVDSNNDKEATETELQSY
ncbi:prepilin-type N-terminal cleavage/methylation domain-containing protein [Guptibacillus hwajinpoensis]|uniref:Type IV pilus assembly protein PilA n=1 Tax=Guptibacillus hwajinpoensis TaxID=208199 RepID=A0ABU0JWI5_9BACL|nr:prepilin-type N-terminal cleavage/methylation domain-containing protein [Alkalihalobacillus hemicentroti]MDQ0481428.1 type IV pilus assembly protein PilA [Alkalihalobacillus hemicentroti]